VEWYAAVTGVSRVELWIEDWVGALDWARNFG